MASRKSRLLYAHRIKSVDDLLKNVDLRYETRDWILYSFNCISFAEITADRDIVVKMPLDKDEFLGKIENAGLISVDWDLQEAPDGNWQNRKFDVTFLAGACIGFGKMLDGEKSKIDFKLLEHIADKLGQVIDYRKVDAFFTKNKVGDERMSAKPNIEPADQIYYVLTSYAITGDQKEFERMLQLIEQMLNPVVLGLSDQEIHKLRCEISVLLKHVGKSVLDGKVHDFTEKDEKLIRAQNKHSHGILVPYEIGEAKRKSDVVAKQKACNISKDILNKLSSAKEWGQVRLEICGDGHHLEVYIQDRGVGKYHFDQLGFQKAHATNKSTAVACWSTLKTMAMNKGVFPYKTTGHAGKRMGELTLRLKILFSKIDDEKEPIICKKRSREYICQFVICDKIDKRNEYADHQLNTMAPEDLDYMG